MQTKFKYPLNAVAKDIITGFTGIIVNRTAHLFGCSQYGLAPQELSADGSPRNTEHFDEARIEIVDDSNAIYGDDEFNSIFSIPLGTEVRDKVSEYQGKVLVNVENTHNCNQYYVELPIDKDGKMQGGAWFDEGRLSVIGEGIKPEEVAAPKRGSVFSRDLPMI